MSKLNSRILVLGLLQVKPMYGYEVKKWLEDNYAQAWAGVLPGSIYNALKGLAREGLVEIAATEKSGLRLRAVYRITPSGRKELGRLLETMWQATPVSFPTELYIAVNFLNYLPRQAVLQSISKVLPELERKLSTWNAGEKATAEASKLSDTGQAVFANGREHMQADVRFLRRLQALLR